MSRHDRFKVLRRVAVCAVLSAAVPLGSVQSARSADPLQDETSLKFAPDNVAFYASSLRLGEVFSNVANSKAIAKVKSMPMVQMGTFMAMAQWENPQNPQLAAFKQALQDPANQQLVGMLKDAVSHEVFVYGDDSYGPALVLANELNAASTAGQFEALAANEPGKVQEYQIRKVLEVLDQKGDQLKIPTTVLGFKLSDTAAAQAQLQRLEMLGKAILGQNPAFAPRFTREQLGGGDFLTLRLDGSLIPWPMLQAQATGIDPAQLNKLIERLSKMTLVISLGSYDDYLMLSIGADNKHLNELGKGALLLARDEMAPVREAASKPITGVSYASAAFMEQVESVDRQMDQLTGLAKQFMPMAPISADVQEELVADIEKFAEFVKSKVPNPAARSAFSYLTPEGYESFTYHWSTDTPFDASQKLSILNHVGANPLAFYAARGKPQPEDYEQVATLVERVAYYAEQITLQQADEDQKQAYQKLRDRLMPLAESFAAVTREKLFPAFQDGQSALVLDAKTTSKSWHVSLPPSDAPLPMLELGMVTGVSDANLVKLAFSEYFAIAQELLDTLHDASTGELKDFFPDEIPQIKLTKPQSRDMNGGTVYYYALPAESGLDKQLAPNAGLSESIMAVSLIPKFTGRLLKDSPLQGAGPLADVDRPLAAAGHLDFAGLLTAIEPWVDYGMQLAGAFNTSTQPGGPMGGDVGQQVKDVFEVLKCFRGVSSVTYQDGQAMVTHTQCQFQDLQ